MPLYWRMFEDGSIHVGVQAVEGDLAIQPYRVFFYLHQKGGSIMLKIVPTLVGRRRSWEFQEVKEFWTTDLVDPSTLTVVRLPIDPELAGHLNPAFVTESLKACAKESRALLPSQPDKGAVLPFALLQVLCWLKKENVLLGDPNMIFGQIVDCAQNVLGGAKRQREQHPPYFDLRS